MPAYTQKGLWCPTCETQRLCTRRSMTGWAHALHILLTISSLGLWLLVYLPLLSKRTGQPWLCSVCGSKAKTT